jgi:hypothetical protein
MWQLLIPIIGGAFVCYTIYRNVFVGQVGTYAHLPYIEGVWLVIGLVVVCAAPGLASRVRAGLRQGSVDAPKSDQVAAGVG